MRFCRRLFYGWVMVAIAFAIILLGAGTAIRDSAGDYTLAYLTAGWMAVAAGVVALALRRTSRPEPKLAAA